jgi:ParB-like chromosome segregation protein Spo0J
MAKYFVSPAYNITRVHIDKVQANSYNPNKMAPPELYLLIKSILEDGYTQPVVCYYLSDVDRYELVDGFHRYLAMKMNSEIYEREGGCLPVSVIDKPLTKRMASTVRHNRAKGTHSIDLMVDIVKQLTEAGLSDNWIKKNIGMDDDELLRLKQISGLASLFAERDFSLSWKSDGAEADAENEEFEDEESGDDMNAFFKI